MPTKKLTEQILQAAIIGLQEQKKRIDAKLEELRVMLAGGSAENHTEPKSAPTPKKAKRKMSAAARKAIADAQRKRWAAVKRAKR